MLAEQVSDALGVDRGLVVHPSWPVGTGAADLGLGGVDAQLHPQASA